LPQEQLVAVGVLFRARCGEVFFDTQNLTVVGNTAEQNAAFGVEKAALGLDQDLPELWVVLLGMNVLTSAGLELCSRRFAGGDQVCGRTSACTSRAHR
jgi:hypothetical protein